MGGERDGSWILSSTCDSERRPYVPSSLAEMMTITRSGDPAMEISLVAEWEKMKYWLAERQASAVKQEGAKMSSKRGTLMVEVEEFWQRFCRVNSVHVCMRSDYRETRTGKVVIYTSQSNIEKSSGCVFCLLLNFGKHITSAIWSNNWILEPSH